MVEENSIPTVKFLKIDKLSIIPKIHTDGAAGYDIHSIEEKNIIPGEETSIDIGLMAELDGSLFGMIFGRSGISLNHGLEVVSSYVNNNKPIVVNVINRSDTVFKLEKGMRIAQLVFFKKDTIDFSYEYMKSQNNSDAISSKKSTTSNNE